MKNTPTVTIGSDTEIAENGVWNINELEEKVIKPNQWGAVNSKTFKAVSVTHEKLPAGCYSIIQDNRDDQPIFIGKDIKNDDIFSFDGDLTTSLLTEIDGFWKKEDVFKKHGFLHRRGYLLYGAAGVGKSSLVWQVARDVIGRGGIVFVCNNPTFFTRGLATFRKVEPRRPIVCVFEDIDAIIAKYGETEILQLLDGDNQINRVINIATTNYPELLDKRIVARPRRFDRLYKISGPSESVRAQYLEKKLTNHKDKDRWIKATKGLTFAALTESLISVLCLGNKLTDTIKILKDIENNDPKSSDFGTKKELGFGKSKKDDDDFDPLD